MRPVIAALCAFVVSLFQSRWAMQLKMLALQHQMAVYTPTVSLDAISLVASSCGYYRGQIEQRVTQ